MKAKVKRQPTQAGYNLTYGYMWRQRMVYKSVRQEDVISRLLISAITAMQ